MPKIERDVEQEDSIWNARMVTIMFDLIQDKLELTSDDFAAACRAVQVPPQLIRKACPCLLKSFKNQGYIKRVRDRFLTSNRTGKPIQVYQCLKATVKLGK